MRNILQFVERRLHPRYPVGQMVDFGVIERVSSVNVTGLQKAVMADIGKNGCSLLVDKLTLGGLYLLKCLEDRDAYTVIVRFDIAGNNVALPELPGHIRWIDNVSENADRRFRIGVDLISPLDAETLTRMRGVLEKRMLESIAIHSVNQD